MSRTDSGYASATSSEAVLPDVYFTCRHLKYLNQQLKQLNPEGAFNVVRCRSTTKQSNMSAEILRWSITTFPSLYQTTAFGPSGLVTLDLLSKVPSPYNNMPIDIIFLDTLHHFPETLSLVERVKQRYHNLTVHVFKPEGVETAQEFTAKHGERLWETNDELYDWVAKVEPAQRAYAELQVKAVLTGRRRSQGGKRGDLKIIEVDQAGLIKINPLANWTFEQVRDYIREHNLPYNELLDKGYKSIGDWHSTQYVLPVLWVFLSQSKQIQLTKKQLNRPVSENEDERSGRWKGQEKTECGIHNPRSKFAQYLRQQKLKKQEEALQLALQNGSAIQA